MSSRHNPRNEHVQRGVLLWVTVTLVLWAALPVAMYLSHWQWFAWMPKAGSVPPLHGVLPANVHMGPSPTWASMAILLMMSSVSMAVVLWLLSVRGHRSARD